MRGGRPPLGSHVAGTEVADAIAALLEDGYTRAAIAAALGYRTGKLQFGRAVTRRTLLRVRRLRRQWTT